VSSIMVFPAELLLGSFDMAFDPALARLEVAQRHGLLPYLASMPLPSASSDRQTKEGGCHEDGKAY